MSNTQDRAVSVAAAKSSAAQFGFDVGRRQLALERYVAAIAGDEPAHLWASAAPQQGDGQGNTGAPAVEATVSSVMVAAVPLPVTTRFDDVLRALATNAVTAIAVVDEHGMPVGVVSEADLLLHAVAGDDHSHTRWHRAPRPTHHRPRSDVTAGDLMSSPAITTTPDASITEAATTAAHAHIKVLPVVGADGRLVGMLSRAALLATYVRGAEQRPTG